MEGETVVRLDIKGIQKIIVAAVDENTPEFLEYVKRMTEQELECFDFETIIKAHITSAFREKVSRFFLFGEGKEMLDREFAKIFTKEG